MMSSIRPSNAIPPTLTRPLGTAVRVLLLAWDYAALVHQDPWDFAVEAALLQALGAANSDLRWLIHQGYAHHALERTTPADRRRLFGPLDPAVLTDKSCFVLTEAGSTAARSFAPGGSTQNEVPYYHRGRGELWVCGILVKRLRQRAPDQRSLFDAFQDQRWPFRIADPLSSGDSREEQKLRLNHVIYRANQHHAYQLIRFGGDGTGEGVLWEPWGPNRLRLSAMIERW